MEPAIRSARSSPSRTLTWASSPRDGRSTLVVLTPAGQEIFDRGLPLFHQGLGALDAALEGTLREHEDAVRRVRLALQELSARASR